MGEAVQNIVTKINYDNDGIPIIDLASITLLDHLPKTNDEVTDRNIAELIADVGDACEKWGVFRLVNHGVNLGILESARKFFALSKEEKMKVCKDETCPMGYSDEGWRQMFEFSSNESVVIQQAGGEVCRLTNRWPDYPAELREASQEYARRVEKLGVTLLELIALSLGVAANRLIEFHQDATLCSRFLLYTPQHDPEIVLREGTHVDTACFTVIAQDDIGGLEIQRKLDSKWIDLKPLPGALTVNIGAVVQVWSNDKYHSVVHRVRPNANKERISIPSLFGPAYYVDVKPLEELINEHNRAKYRKYNWGVFRASRVNDEQSTECQDISQFRITRD